MSNRTQYGIGAFEAQRAQTWSMRFEREQCAARVGIDRARQRDAPAMQRAIRRKRNVLIALQALVRQSPRFARRCNATGRPAPSAGRVSGRNLGISTCSRKNLRKRCKMTESSWWLKCFPAYHSYQAKLFLQKSNACSSKIRGLHE